MAISTDLLVNSSISAASECLRAISPPRSQFVQPAWKTPYSGLSDASNGAVPSADSSRAMAHRASAAASTERSGSARPTWTQVSP